MIHIVTAENSNIIIAMKWSKLFGCAIKVFVEEMGWTDLAKPDRS